MPLHAPPRRVTRRHPELTACKHRTAARLHNEIHGSNTRKDTPSAEKLQKYAKAGEVWLRKYGATLEAGSLPDTLAGAHPASGHAYGLPSAHATHATP